MKTRQMVSASMAALAICSCEQPMAPQSGTNDEVTTSLQLLADNMQILNSAAATNPAARRLSTLAPQPDTGFSALYSEHDGWVAISEVLASGYIDTTDRSGVFHNAHRTETFNQDSVQSVSSIYINRTKLPDSSGQIHADDESMESYRTATMRTGFVYHNRSLDSSEAHHYESLQHPKDSSAFATGYPKGFLISYPGDLVVPVYAWQTLTSDQKRPIFKNDRIVGYAETVLESNSFRLTNITDDKGNPFIPRPTKLGHLPGDSLGVQLRSWSIDSSTFPLTLELDVSWNFTPNVKTEFVRMTDRVSLLTFDLYTFTPSYKSRGGVLRTDLDSLSGQQHFKIPLDSIWTSGAIDPKSQLQLSISVFSKFDSIPYFRIQSRSRWLAPSQNPRP